MLTWLAGLLVVLGAFVQARGAGLACPDWPLCYGHAVPAFDAPIFAQWLHRLGSLGLFFSLLVRAISRMHWTNGLALLLGSVYVALGALAVMSTLDPVVVTAQQLCGLAIIAALKAGQARVVRRGAALKGEPWPAATKHFAIGLTLVVLAVIGGSFISAEQAGLACPTILSCHGLLWPHGDAVVGLHLTHRIVSFFLLAWAASLPVVLMRETLPNNLRLVVRLMPLFVLAELAVGVGDLVFRLPWSLSIVHLALAVGMFALLVQATLDSRIIPSRRRPVAHAGPGSPLVLGGNLKDL